MLTITEALAEIGTIQKRLEKKREFVGAYLGRPERLKDPLEKDGGSRQAIARERQAIADLEERVVVLRRAISAANTRTEVTVGGVTRPIADWLTWRREVAQGQKAFLDKLRGTVAYMRVEAAKKGVRVVSGDEAGTAEDIVVNVDERELATATEQFETVMGALDGQLSLKNATTAVEVA